MIALIRLFLAVLASLFRSKLRLGAENTVLRQQVIVLRRKLRAASDSQTATAYSLSGWFGYSLRPSGPS